MNEKLRNSYNFDLNELFCGEENSEILWSREHNILLSENDVFKNRQDFFFDLTERSTSSGSWHNDDFDIQSSAKVSKSLDAVENALYEKECSPFISEEVYQECCDWSSKFSFLRIKGEQIAKNKDDCFMSNPEEYISCENSLFSLQVEGKKMALHMPEKCVKKNNIDNTSDLFETDLFEEVIFSHHEKEEFSSFLEGEFKNLESSESEEQGLGTEITVDANSLQEKVFEKLAQHIWPKVLEVLENCDIPKKRDKPIDDIQLPPILAVQAEQRRYVQSQRPKTEGSNLSVVDFPKLSSFLSVSPKVLQERKDCKSGRSTLRSRPNSEIHAKRNNAQSSYASKIFPFNASNMVNDVALRQAQLVSKKNQKKEEIEKMTLYLPALEEDINDPVDYLKRISLQTETKNVSSSLVSHFPKKPECFLPPIDMDTLNPDAKLTRNLFTFFSSDVKCLPKREAIYKPKTPASRPSTCASKKSLKHADNLNYRFLNDSYSSIKNSNHAGVKEIDGNSDKQVTLFPIVTSLVPRKEKNCASVKKNFLSGFSERKR